MYRHFCTPPERSTIAQTHVCQVGCKWKHVHLLSRDYLRGQPQERRHYIALKRERAWRWGADRLVYPDAKAPYLLEPLARAYN